VRKSRRGPRCRWVAALAAELPVGIERGAPAVLSEVVEAATVEVPSRSRTVDLAVGVGQAVEPQQEGGVAVA
jgi:hypothetical protein